MTRPAQLFSRTAVVGGLVYTSGLAAIDPVAMRPSAPDFAGQCAEVMAQLDAALAEHGLGRDHLVRLECYLADRDDFGEWNAIYAQMFAGLAHPPARTTLVVGLPVEGLLIEVQAVARGRLAPR